MCVRPCQLTVCAVLRLLTEQRRLSIPVIVSYSSRSCVFPPPPPFLQSFLQILWTATSKETRVSTVDSEYEWVCWSHQDRSFITVFINEVSWFYSSLFVIHVRQPCCHSEGELFAGTGSPHWTRPRQGVWRGFGRRSCASGGCVRGKVMKIRK